MSIDDAQIKKLKEEMLDVLVLANQSGKKETSGIVSEVLKRMKDERELVKTELKKDIEDAVNKAIAENPSMVVFAKMQNAASVAGWLLQTVVLIGAAFAVFNWHNVSKIFNQQ